MRYSIAQLRAGAAGPIDVLIPVYNGAAWLCDSIASIQRQSCRALEIHVVDDGSTDSTPALLAKMAAGDERLHIHRKDNGGIVDALNHGLQFCRSNWVARHDADDIADPARFELQLAYLLENPDCVAVGANARHIDAAGRPLGTTTELRPPEKADFAWVPAREPYLMHPFMMARREALAAVRGYRHSSHSEDSDLYWRLRELGRLHNLPQVLGDYRMHASSISSGSIHNGRLMAVGSQLAALSARRRSEGRADLSFSASRATARRRLVSLRELLDEAALGLDGTECEGLELSVAAKLLELTSYLPYELEPDDCRQIRHAVRRQAALLRASNRAVLLSQLTRASVRLFVAGRRRDAWRLLPAGRLPEFFARLLWRSGLSTASREWLRRRLGHLSTGIP